MFDEDGNLTRTWIIFFERLKSEITAGAGRGWTVSPHVAIERYDRVR